MKLEFSQQSFEKYSHIKFHENLSGEPSCPMRTDGQTGTTKLLVAFLNFANAPKNKRIDLHSEVKFWP
jgi:hypothetical protein